MNMLNSLILDGVTVGEPQYLDILPKLKFTIDYTREFKNGNGEDVTEHSQFDVVAYGEHKKSLISSLKNGTGVRVVGRLKQDKWEDLDGVTHSKVYIVAEHIEIRKTK